MTTLHDRQRLTTMAAQMPDTLPALDGPAVSTRSVHKHARLLVDDGICLDCGEVSPTELAETLANTFDLYQDDAEYTIPDEVFDLAALVAEEHEASIWLV